LWDNYRAEVCVFEEDIIVYGVTNKDISYMEDFDEGEEVGPRTVVLERLFETAGSECG
jgi:hypothetical protein